MKGKGKLRIGLWKGLRTKKLLLFPSSRKGTGTPEDIKRIAVIPMGDPFKIMLFDGSQDSYTTIWAWVNDFESDKTVIIEIQ
jgi:hypothetical protein